MAVSGITYAGKAIENINIANESAYLAGMIKSGSAGQKSWATKQLSVLENAVGSFNNFIGNTAAGSGSSQAASAPVQAAAPEVTKATTTEPLPDFNSDSFGFLPSDYTNNSTVQAPIGTSGGTIAAYVVTGLVLLVVLDKLMR